MLIDQIKHEHTSLSETGISNFDLTINTISDTCQNIKRIKFEQYLQSTRQSLE